MTPAPAFDCCRCRRRIGKSGGHYLHRDGRVFCARCVRALDLYDHLRYVASTRAAIAHVLGLWP